MGLENFETLFHDPLYLDSLMTTLQFSISVAVLALVSALILSAFAEQIIRGATMYRTFLIWYLCGGSGCRRFTMAISIRSNHRCDDRTVESVWRRLESNAQWHPCYVDGDHHLDMEANQLQLSVLPCGASISTQVSARSRVLLTAVIQSNALSPLASR